MTPTLFADGSILWIQILQSALILLVMGAMTFFGVQKYWDRQEDRKRRRVMEQAVAAMEGLLALNDLVHSKVTALLEDAVRKVLGEIRSVPEPVATKVVEKMDEAKLFDSGTLKKAPPKSEGPPK